MDSTTYYWTTTDRGAAHNPKNPNTYFDNFSPFADASAEPNSYRQQVIAADSVVGDSCGVGKVIKRYSYDAADRPTQYAQVHSGVTYRTTILSYNGAGQVVFCSTASDTGFLNRGVPSGLIPESRQYSTYNAAGQLVKDSIVQLIWAGGTTVYMRNYNSTGALAGVLTIAYHSLGVPDSADRASFSYYSNGLLRTALYQYYNKPALNWVPSGVDSFSYAGSNPAYTYMGSFYWSAGSQTWMPAARTVTALNAAGNWDVVTKQYPTGGGSTWTSSQKWVYNYNSFGNLEQLNAYYANNGVFPPTPNTTYNFYFETYNSSVGVSSLYGVKSACTIVPNPASGSFEVLRSGKGTARYSLLDATGRVLRSGMIMAEKETIDAGGIPAGLYFLKVQEEGASSETHRVVLQ